MANRDLAASFVEGGHYKDYQCRCKQYRRRVRAQERQFCKEVKADPNVYDQVCEPVQETAKWRWDCVSRHFAPACRRWLQSQVGKRWVDVKSLLRKRFDVRKYRNWLLVQTIEEQVCEAHRGDHKCWDDYIVIDGILTYPWERARRTGYDQLISKQELKSWVGQRAITQQGTVLFWMELTRGSYWDMVKDWRYYSTILQRDWIRYKPRLVGNYRQGNRLSKSDVELWNKLTDRQKNWCLERNPNHK